MDFIGRIFVFLIALGLGMAVILRSKFFVDITGSSAWAERSFGVGGTYTLWKGIGLLIIILGFLFLLGEFTFGPTIP